MFDHEAHVCRSFLSVFQHSDDPTWGFQVYGTYTRPQDQKDADKESDVNKDSDDARFHALLSKLHAHAADNLRVDQPAPYNQQLIDSLRLWPAARLPGASLADVCTHFRKHHAVVRDPENMCDRDDEETPEDQKFGPKYEYCVVIDDESLKSIDDGPEPIGPAPPEGMQSWQVAANASKVFVKLLSQRYTTMKPEVIASCGRGPNGIAIVWEGWLKFSPTVLMRLYSFPEFTAFFEGTDTLLEFG